MNNSIVNIKPYVVNSGDNLSKIAKKNNTTVQDILSLNAGIVDPNVISVGQVINLPENVNSSQNVEMIDVAPVNNIANPVELPNQNLAAAPEEVAINQAALEAQQAQANAVDALQMQLQAEAIEKINSQNIAATPVAPGMLSSVALPQDVETLNMLYGLVAAEAGPSNGAEEARAVADVLINRVRSGQWGGSDLRSVMTSPKQFSVISNGRYKTTTPTLEQINAINEEFAKSSMGLPTTYNYSRFRANNSGYSATKVTPNGNEYRV